MLFLVSPVNTNLISLSGLCACSSIVKKSANIWVGWSASVNPFHTGTPACLANSSTVDCLNPLNSIPSYILPRTLAVSSIDSFLPICELVKNVTWAPSSAAPHSKAHLVLVEVFSNSKTTFLPFKLSPNIPALFLAFKSWERSNKYLISAGVKSFNVKKLLPFKLTAILNSS